MPNYKSLYFQLFNQVTDIIEAFKKAQQDAEEAYVEGKDDVALRIAERECGGEK